ncbi:GNAT family N-acetyltransferase [Almyronema epifaneia]|uniref:GNAT family N-acetyltransferase n=1 Tax=Almyronema epifaneia S1 TaxID=2991925 RepID=A0ABW6IIM4_9CYAN
MSISHPYLSFTYSGESISFRVRTAGLEDLNQLADILVASFYPQTGWMYFVYPLLRLGIYEDLKHRFRSQPARYACFAVQSAEATLSSEQPVIGTVELSCRPAQVWPFSLTKYPYVSNLAVHQQFRRRGVARQLLQACEQTARSWGFRSLYLHVMEDNQQARHLYTKMGYQLKQAEWNPWGALWGKPQRLLLYKPLP